MESTSSRRRIRFAPLLDPRRAVVITDDGNELPIKDDTHFPAATSLAVLAKNYNITQTQKQAVTPFSDPDPPLLSSSTMSTSASSSSASSSSSSPSDSPDTSKPKPPPRSFTVNILKSFNQRSPSADTKTRREKSKSLTFSPEEILTLGAINLFRASDKEREKSREICSDDGSPSTRFVWGLPRRTNAGANNNKNDDSSPLSRTHSPQGYKKHKSSMSALFSVPASPSLVEFQPKARSLRAKTKMGYGPPTTSGCSSTITSGSSYKGTRMLNGRIYGAKSNHNPFANAADDEPEFVEWGYGGMGSSKGAKNAGVAIGWERLYGQEQTEAWIAPGGGRGGVASRKKANGSGNEEAEGEEQKEEDDEEDDGSGLAWVKKRRKMREEQERKEREARAGDDNENGHAIPNASTSGVHQNVKAVNIPMPQKQHSHSGHYGSISSQEGDLGEEEPANGYAEVDAGETRPGTNTASLVSSTAEEENNSNQREVESETSDEEQETDNKMAIGAGMEKVSSSRRRGD